MNYRIDRLNGELQKEITNIINNKVKDPRVTAMVSVLSVDCAKDLKTAKVYLSIYGDETAVNTTFDALVKCAGFIRKELSVIFHDLRTIPTLTFILDKSAQYGAKIESILEEIKKNESSK